MLNLINSLFWDIAHWTEDGLLTDPLSHFIYALSERI